MRLLLFIMFVLFYVTAQAQHTVYVYPPETKDTLKISVSFANSDLAFEDVQGIQGEVDLKFLRGDKFRLGGVFHYIRPTFQGHYKIDTYSLGPQLSYDVFNGRMSIFGRALFGVTTDYDGTNTFTRTYGAGADVNFGNFFVRPIVLDFQRFEGVPITVQRLGAGAGVRF